MKKTYLLLMVLLCGILCLAPKTAFAAESPVGISAHYAHPLNGTVEDPGNNAAIGQGMVQSVLDDQGTYEESGGNAWLTVHLHMADRLGAAKFAVQNRGDGSFFEVSAQEVGRSGDSVSYRFQVPASNAVIRVEVEVKDMGRAVIFYGLLDGNVNLPASEQTTSSTNASTSGGQHTTTTNSSHSNASGSGTKRDASTLGKAVKTKEAKKSDLEGDHFGDDHGLLTKDSPELAELTGRGGHLDASPWGTLTRGVVIALIVVLSLITFTVVVGAIALWIFTKKLRYFNDLKEATLYDAEERL